MVLETIAGVLLDYFVDSGSSVAIIAFNAWTLLLDAKPTIVPEQRNVHALNCVTLNEEGICYP